MVTVSLPLSISHSPPDLPPSSSRTPIYCLDLNPTSSRLATGGGDGRVKIWSTTAVFQKTKKNNTRHTGRWGTAQNGDKDDEDDSSNNTEGYSSYSGTDSDTHPVNLLYATPASQGSVMCLRWSPPGDRLAAGSDTSLTTVYALSPQPHVSVGFGSAQESYPENWVKSHVLRHHDLDVVSLTWSPTSSTLVTASLDSKSPLCVWDVPLGPGPAVLGPRAVLGRDVHAGGCKGVSFDPTGGYFASTCDGPGLTIWSSLTHQACKSTASCFAGTHDLTMFRRISWSPDGVNLAATNCNVSSKSCSTILDRETLETRANLVGHKSAVCAARYSRSMWGVGGGADYAVYLASGDKRGFVTVWCNRESRPVFKFQASARKLGVTDISWRGDVLAVSCLDGGVTFVKFGLKGEMGEEERSRVFKEKYGSAGGVRNIDVMRIRAAERPGPDETGANGAAPRAPVMKPSPVKNHEDVLRLQQVTKKKGKKRIAPVLVSAEQGHEAVSAPAVANTTAPVMTTTTTTTTMTTSATNVLAARKKPKPSAASKQTGKGGPQAPLTVPPPVPSQPKTAATPAPAGRGLPPCAPVPSAKSHILGDIKITPNTPHLPTSHPTHSLVSPTASFAAHGRCTCAVRMGELVATGNDLGEVRVFDVKGSGVLLSSPVVKLGSAICLLYSSEERGRVSLTVVTETGDARSWWIGSGGADLEMAARASVRDIIMKGYVSFCNLLSGRLVATVTTSDSGYGRFQHYFFDLRADCWMRLADSRFSKARASDGAVGAWESKCENARPLATLLKEGGQGEKMQERVVVARRFGGGEEDGFARDYVTYLCQKSEVAQVRDYVKRLPEGMFDVVVQEVAKWKGMEDLVAELCALSKLRGKN